MFEFLSTHHQDHESVEESMNIGLGYYPRYYEIFMTFIKSLLSVISYYKIRQNTGFLNQNQQLSGKFNFYANLNYEKIHDVFILLNKLT